MTLVIGFLGGLAVLAGFAGVAMGRMSTHGAGYHALNLAGGLALVAAGLAANAWPSMMVNAAWALISAHGIARAARTRSNRPRTHP